MKKYLLAVAALLGAAALVWQPASPAPAMPPSTVQAASQAEPEARAVSLRIEGEALHATWEDTALAQEILGHFPLPVEMVGYGGREYYGPLDFRPSSAGEGKLSFEDGDITYCPKNNTLAIFYAQTERPNLTMEVIRVGKLSPEDLPKMHELADSLTATFSLE